MVDMHSDSMAQATDTERRIEERKKEKNERNERGTVHKGRKKILGNQRDIYSTYIYHDTSTEYLEPNNTPEHPI